MIQWTVERLIGFTKVSLIFSAGVVAGTGHPWFLIPVAVGGGAAWLFWGVGASHGRSRSVAERESRPEQLPVSTRSDGRLELLETEVEMMRKEQSKLREALRWQEELLHQTTQEPVGR